MTALRHSPVFETTSINHSIPTFFPPSNHNKSTASQFHLHPSHSRSRIAVHGSGPACSRFGLRRRGGGGRGLFSLFGFNLARAQFPGRPAAPSRPQPPPTTKNPPLLP